MWRADDRSGQRPICSVCGQELVGDPDDEVTHPTGPMCGDCYRARAFDDQLWALDASEEGAGDPW